MSTDDKKVEVVLRYATIRQMSIIDSIIEEYKSDPDYRSELVTIAHAAVMVGSALAFEHWSHWWFLLGLAAGLNLLRLAFKSIATNIRNERECDEFIRRHYRL